MYKMKKWYCASLLFFLPVFAFSCNFQHDSYDSNYSDNSTSSENNDSKTAENDTSVQDTNIYLFDKAVNFEYSSFDVSVRTTKDDLSLSSFYSVSKEGDGLDVSYKIEKYNEIKLEDSSLPDDIISISSGNYHVSDGKIDFSSFGFDTRKYQSFELKENSLSIFIENAKSYLNASYNCNRFYGAYSFEEKMIEISHKYYLDDDTYCEIKYSNFE